MSELRVALVGAGNIALRAYLPAIRELISRGYPIRLIGACEVSPEVARAFQRECEERLYPVRTYQDLDELLELEPDLMIICTPTHTHHQIAMKALQVGSHVVLEKPITRYSWQAEELLDLARSKGLALMVAHPRRFDPRIMALREVLASGALGELIYLRFSERAGLGEGPSWRWLHELSGGVLLDVGIHYVHLVRWLFGRELIERADVTLRARRVRPASRRWGAPDWAELTLADRELVIDIEVSWAHPRGISEDAVHVEAYGTEGFLSLRSLDEPGVLVTDEGMHRASYSPLYSAPLEAFISELSYAVELITSGRHELTYQIAQEAVDALRLINELEEDMKEALSSSSSSS